MYVLRMFFKIVKYRYKALAEYPGSFFAGVVAQWMNYGLDMFVLFLIVGQFGTLAGWIPGEVIFFYAVWLLSYAIGASFTFNVTQSFPQMAINGTLDEALIRPMPALVFLIAAYYNIAYISHVTITIAALAYTISNLHISWTVPQWVWFIVVIICAAIIQGCLMLIFDMPSLRTRSRSPVGIFFWQTRLFLQYPLNIYPKVLQFIFTTVLPFGFVSFYPLQVLLGRDEGAFTGVVKWLSPLVAILLIGITALCWRFVTRRYESSGT